MLVDWQFGLAAFDQIARRDVRAANAKLGASVGLDQGDLVPGQGMAEFARTPVTSS